jgi:hypothetical protein
MIMRVLVACEFSGTVRDAFLARGHDAWSCDLLSTESDDTDDKATRHLQGDVKQFLGDEWDLMIAHPPCTYLCSSGMHWNKRRPERAALTTEALGFVASLLVCDAIPRICVENPIGIISTYFWKPTQIIHPHQFGHDASKATCLWLKNLPPLRPTQNVAPRMINGKPRWANQTDSGQNRLPPSKNRWKLRSETYPGIADAMADQWGSL